MIKYCYIVLLTAIAFVGCQKRNYLQPRKQYTTNELSKIILPGMSLNDITNLFGLPSGVIIGKQNKYTLTYLMLSRSEPSIPASRVVGYNVTFKNGRVEEWRPLIITNNTVDQYHSVGNFNLRKKEKFKFFIGDSLLTASTNDRSGTNVYKNFNFTPHSLPVMTMDSQVFMETNDLNDRRMFLKFNETNVPRIQELTLNNIGKRLLVVWHNELIASPLISTPIGTNSMSFKIKKGVNITIDTK